MLDDELSQELGCRSRGLHILRDLNCQAEAKVHWAWEAMGDVPPQDWLVEGVLTTEMIGVAVGAPGSLKTYTMIDMCLAIASGQNWLDLPTKAGSVLYVDEEGGLNSFNRRLKALMAGRKIERPEAIPMAFTNMQSFDLRNDDSVSRLRGVLDEVKPVLMVVDALADVMPGGDENSARDTVPIFRNLRDIGKEYSAGVMVLHHPNKSGEFRGSTAIKAAVDLMIDVKAEVAKHSSTRRVCLKTDKARDIEPFELEAEFTFIRPALFGDLSEVRATRVRDSRRPSESTGLTGCQQAVLDFLSACPEQKAMLTAIKQSVASHSPRSVEDAVSFLREREMLQRCNGGGRGTRAEFQLL